MPNYRRVYQQNGYYFFTVVSYQRQPVFIRQEFRKALRTAILKTQKQYPFENVAMVLLPDHLHCIWRVPEGDVNYSRRWSLIKRQVSQHLSGHFEGVVSCSRGKRRESLIWQRRFWEHQILDEEDLQAHLDYCYWNPVKHGLVSRVSDWLYSTFHRDVRRGLYPLDWGGDYCESDGLFGE